MKETILAEIRTRDEAEAAVAMVAALTLQQIDETNQQNAKLLVAREHDQKIKDLGERIAEHQARLEAWARTNREELGLGGEENKSLNLRQGTVGFRWGNPKLVCGKGWDWDKVTTALSGEGLAAALAKIFTGLRKYLRVKIEVDRQALLAAAKPSMGELSKGELRKLGLAVEREESFYVEPKIEPVTP